MSFQKHATLGNLAMKMSESDPHHRLWQLKDLLAMEGKYSALIADGLNIEDHSNIVHQKRCPAFLFSSDIRTTNVSE